MATTYYNDLQKLYVAYFNRPGDAGGLDYYEGLLEKSTDRAATLAGISADFAKSTEYTAAFSGKSSAEIVDIIYQNLFGHPADAGGKKYYADFLDSKTLTVANVVTEVAKGAQGSDLTAYNNKLAASAAFTAAVDTDAEKKGYSGDAANKIAKAWLAGVTDNVSLASATAPAKLNTVVAQTVAAGTPFTVAGALATMDAAQTAYDKFVESVDVDGDPDTTTHDTDITAAYTTTINNVAAKLTSGADLFMAPTTSDTVRDALISAQQAVNSANLTTKQGLLSDANTAISKVAGLSAAVTTLTAAKAAETAAGKTLTAASADVAAKEGAFEVNNAGELKVVTAEDGSQTLVLDPTASTATNVTLATISASGKVTVASGLDTSKYAGVTELIAAYNTKVAATTANGKAHDATVAAQTEVNHLDVDTTATYGTTGKTEAQLLNDVTNAINTYATAHPTQLEKVATGSTATEAQITTALKVMETNSATDFGTFSTLVTNYHGAAAVNPRVTEFNTETTAVKNANTAISDLAKLVAKMDAAEQNVTTMKGLEATLIEANKVLGANGYHLADAGNSTDQIGTSASDVFKINSLETGDNVTLSLFNLQGNDSVFVGSTYKLVQGEMTDVKGDPAALEVFLSANDDGDAVLQIETSTFGSNASTPEVITITLTGVDATTLHLNNGIISAGTIA